MAAALILLIATGQGYAQQAEQTDKFTAFGEAYQFVFYSVVEGLYRDGANQTDVERILLKQGDDQWYDHFIYSCEICTSVLLAVQLYNKRPALSMYKGHPTSHAFGDGFSSAATQGLRADDVKVRLTTIHGLVARWIDERMDRMHLPEEERVSLRRAFEDGRQQGMRALQGFQKDPELLRRYAPGYAGLDECAICNAANHMDFQ